MSRRKPLELRGGTGPAGLITTRKLGEQLALQAHPDASDTELLQALRDGLTITLVGLTLDEQRPTARIGIKGSRAIAVRRLQPDTAEGL